LDFLFKNLPSGNIGMYLHTRAGGGG
jgi:hypothetical protein